MKSEWRDVILKELLIEKGYIRGPFGSALKRPEMKKEGIAVYEQQNAIYDNRIFRFFIDKEKFEELKRFQVKTNDLIISCSGTVGKVSIIKENDEKGIISQALLILRPNSSIIVPLYFKYILQSKYGYNSIISRSSGSVQVNISKREVIEQIPFKIPTLETQHRIASILSALDDKIELNNQINENLEQQAQALFKSWFVDFEPFGGVMPENWRIATLDEVTSKFATGLNPRNNFALGHGENYYVTIKNMANNEVILNDRCDKVDDEAIMKINKRSDLQAGDVLFSGIGTIGRVYYIDKTPTNWNIRESIFTIRANQLISAEYLYLLMLSADMQDYAISLASGSVQKGIRMADLKRYKIILPNKSSMNVFTSIVKPIIEQTKENNRQNKTLTELRDTLLPKLMNCEIDVSEVKI